jgi:quercetin dioxygenase-like cupin family protein
VHIARKNEYVTPFYDEKGERIFELLQAENHSMIRLELEPGAVSPSVPHFHKQSEETYVILSGEAEITIDDQKIGLTAGDIAAAGIGETHQIKAMGDHTMVALAIMAPGFKPDDVFE